MKFKLSVLVVIPMFVAVLAFGKSEHRRAGRDLSDLSERASSIKSKRSGKKYKAPALVTIAPSSSLPSAVLNCGDTITFSVSLANDLICPDTTGAALYIIGNNISVDGAGHRIEAPLAGTGIFVQGSGVSVSRITVNGLLQGTGLFAYDSPGLTLNNNNFSGNNTGIVLYAEQSLMNNILVQGNLATDNSVMGIRTGQAGVGTIESPLISRNDFSRSGLYAMHLGAARFELDDTAANILAGSANGIYLWGGSFYLHDLSLENSQVLFNQIFVDSAVSFNALNLNVSTNLSADPDQKKSGVDLYRVVQFSIKGLIARNNSVGLKLETEGGVRSGGSVSCSEFTGNAVSGIMVQSYDDTPYGVLLISGNRYQMIPAGFNVWNVPPTTYDAASIIISESESCPNDGGGSCTLTQGYWKNHNIYQNQPSLKKPWPISENTQLCGKSWYEILQIAPKKGDAWLILAHQAIAARLNVAKGASTTASVDEALSASASLLQNNCSQSLKGDLRNSALIFANTLDQYNNGLIGPGHCE